MNATNLYLFGCVADGSKNQSGDNYLPLGDTHRILQAGRPVDLNTLEYKEYLYKTICFRFHRRIPKYSDFVHRKRGKEITFSVKILLCKCFGEKNSTLNFPLRCVSSWTLFDRQIQMFPEFSDGD